jgi:hypothetical protein
MGRKAEPMEWRKGCGLPSPKAIEAACERIRAQWSPAELQRRKVTPDTDVETPVIAVSDLTG